jgi:NAD(P)-dependent dehydrogenase (short-subunit alcohol dehydrogenase family)
MKHTGLYRDRPVLLYGAYGHTGRFIVTELLEHGFTPILAGRNAEQLAALSLQHGGLPVAVAEVGDAEALDRAIAGASAVINAAGPFAITATPLIEAAQRSARPYLDIAAEPDIVATTIERHAESSRAAGIPLVPAAAFYGGLGDLLATAVMGDWPRADSLTLAFALSSWKPTRGTRDTIELAERRRAGGRLVRTASGLQLRHDSAPVTEWRFPPPVGTQQVVTEFITGDSVTIPRHLHVDTIHELMTVKPLLDLNDTDHAPPPAVDDRGRSAQTFMIEAVVQAGDQQRRGVIRGQDIYAVSAPLVVRSLMRVLSDPRPGISSVGQLGDARQLLGSLAPEHLSFEWA